MMPSTPTVVNYALPAAVLFCRENAKQHGSSCQDQNEYCLMKNYEPSRKTMVRN